MKRSKLELSNQQLSLLRDKTLWDARRLLLDELTAWMGTALSELKRNHQGVFEKLIPASALNGKITKGENYNGYPYILLDYPNHFSKDDILAARDLIWFGNGFHCTLHIRGSLVNAVLNNLALPPRRFDNVMICVSDNEWIHDLNKRDWVRVNKVNEEERQNMLNNRWLKFGIEIPFSQPDDWTNALVAVYRTWRELLNLPLSNQ